MGKSGNNGILSKAATAALKAGAVASLSNQAKSFEQKNNTKIDKKIFMPKDGRLPDLDDLAREKGYESYKELEEYKKKNPNTFAVLGGYKYEQDNNANNYSSPNKKENILLSEAQKRDSYIQSLQYVMDKEDALRAYEKRSKNIPLTDREIEAEINLKWLKYEISSDQIVEYKQKTSDINKAIVKFNNGEAINEKELRILTENGAQNFTGNNSYNIIDFLAEDNPKNIAAEEKYKKAVEKERRGEKLSEQERADISNYIARKEIKKSMTKDMLTFSSKTKKNVNSLNIIPATRLYNDAIYEKGAKKTIAQMDLYVNTGMTKFFQDTINTGTILMTELEYNLGLGDERASDKLKKIPQSKYEIANNAVSNYFTINDEKFSKFIQDAAVSLSYNAIPMLLSGVSSGTSLVATGISSFGSSYKEAVLLAPDAEEWQYFLYAGLNTATEVCMQKFLSGDTSVFNNSSKYTDSMFKALTKNISNKFLTGGAKLLSNASGEFFEETIQGLLSPVMQEMILDVDTVSILSTNRSEQINAMNNALYDGLLGFASACVSTGLFNNGTIDNINQKETIGAYYNKVFNETNTNIENVARYLKEISNDKNSDLHRSAEKVLNGDYSDAAIADMMIKGIEQSRESQEFVYTKIGELLNQNNKYTAYSLIREYNNLKRSGIELSESITDTYNELVNSEGISRDGFNYLVGKLSTTMDAVIPRASIVNEVKKKINEEILKDNSLENKTKSNNDLFIDGLWDGSPNIAKNNAEKSQLEKVENLSDDDIIRIAREYLRYPEGQKDTRPYLRHRPSYAKNQIETVYENGKNIFGKVYDPSGPQVPWDRSKPRNGQWDMGHIPGQKYSVVHAKYVLEMMTPKEFKTWHDDPRNYRPELPSTNRGHKYE